MLEIKQSCETPQQRKRWHVCVLLPQATGMARGSTPRQELLVSKAGFSNTLHSPQKPTVVQRATVQTKKSNSSCEKPFHHFYSTTKAWLKQ